jgi:hypothetical protein
MSQLQLRRVTIIEVDSELYEIELSAMIKDTEIEGAVSTINLDVFIVKDTENINEIEKKALAKAERLLEAILSSTG